MKNSKPRKRISRMIVWLSYPLYSPLVRGISLFRSGSELVRHLPEHATEADTTSPQAILQDQNRRRAARYRTRNYGIFCGSLLMMFVTIWFYEVFWEGQSILGPVCIQISALVCMLSGQFVFFSFSNWTIRNGRPGSFAEYIADGRNLWPR